MYHCIYGTSHFLDLIWNLLVTSYPERLSDHTMTTWNWGKATQQECRTSDVNSNIQYLPRAKLHRSSMKSLTLSIIVYRLHKLCIVCYCPTGTSACKISKHFHNKFNLLNIQGSSLACLTFFIASSFRLFVSNLRIRARFRNRRSFAAWHRSFCTLWPIISWSTKTWF